MTLPFLSVVLPTYNRADSLRVTLDGLARQDYPPDKYEVLAVSDGSVDGTDALLTQTAKAAPYSLRPLRQQNGGPSRARNFGIREAAGDVVVFIDDDVEPVPGFLRCHARHHVAEKAVAVIAPLSPDPARREPCWIGWEHAMLEKQYGAWRSGAWAADFIGPANFYSGNASVRREHLVAVGGFDEAFPRQEDVELAGRLARQQSVSFRFDAEAVGIHRPLRSWKSWLAVPFAYGRLDVARAQGGDPAGWDAVQQGFHARSRLTQVLAQLCLPSPAGSRAARAALLLLAKGAWAGGRRSASLAALSAIYNVHYLEGARDALGGWPALCGVLHDAPACAVVGPR